MQALPILKNFHKEDKTMKLYQLDYDLKDKVVRLLDRQGYDLQIYSKKETKKFIIFIDPLSKGLLVWNLIFILAFYVIQLQISLSLAFGPHFTQSQLQNAYKPAYFTLLSILIIDLMLSFFKGYHAYGKGKVIDDGRLVAYHYFFTQFFFDLAVIFFYMIPLIHESFALNFLQLIPLTLIWVKKSKCQEEVQYILQYKKGLRSSLVVVLLLGDALLFGNYGACIFIGMDVLLANAQYYGPTSEANPSEYYWLSTNTDYSGYLMNGPWLAQYIYAQFFSTGTLSTMAPGPFARNPIECYAIFVMIFFMIYASYLADVLVQVVYTYSQGRIIHEQNILTFDNFMKLKDVQESTRLRVFNYFELKWQLQFKTQSNQQKLMIEKLPLHLKEELLEQIGFANQLRLLEVLPKTESLKKMISLKIQRSTVDANTCIFQTHKLSNHRRRCLFYIKEGTAKFFINRGKDDPYKQQKPETILNLTTSDRTLGLYEFITGQDFAICCQSIDLCLIQSLEWTAFLEVVSQLKIMEEFFEVQHRVLVERELHLIKKACLVCQKNHLEIECPRIYIQKEIQAEVHHRAHKDIQNRRKVKRKSAKSEKKRPEPINQTTSSGLFGLFKTLNLAKFLTEIVNTEKQKEVPIDEAAYFHKYFSEYNLFRPTKATQQSSF